MYYKTCLRCGKKYIPTGTYQKYCKKCLPIITREKSTERMNKWRKDNPERFKEIKKKFRLTHSEQIKQEMKQWRKNNPEYDKQYDKEHSKEIEQWTKNNPDKYSQIQQRHNNKRRSLGFIPVNKWFESSDFHHLNKEGLGIYVPTKLHDNIRHNIWTEKNMKEMNTLAVQWWITQVMKETHKYFI